MGIDNLNTDLITVAALQLHIYFFPRICYFDVLEYRVGVKDERLAEALAALPSKKRDVILLSYFLDMNDTEIAEKLKVVGATIHYRRTSSLKELKLRLEVKEDGQSAE